ncbi:MAG: hypothetical protein ACOX4I_05670 [Anaerovoracaceae bacterium]
MKKLIAVLVIAVMTVSLLFTGCGGMNEDYSNQLEDDVYGNYEQLKGDLQKMKSSQEIMDYLDKWAAAKIYSPKNSTTPLC